jgi:hypothetical protein
MTSLLAASVIVFPASLFMFVLCSTRLFLRLTGRSPADRHMRAVSGLESHEPVIGSRDTAVVVFFLALGQLLATALIVDGVNSQDPFAMLALSAGLAEWALATIWVALLIARSERQV